MRGHLIFLSVIALAAGSADALPPTERTVRASTSTGQRLTVTLRTEKFFVGGGGGRAVAAFECDAVFDGPMGTVPVTTSLACYIDGQAAVTAQAPGPRAAIAGGGFSTDVSPALCVQGVTEFLEVGLPGVVSSPRYLTISPTCFSV